MPNRSDLMRHAPLIAVLILFTIAAIGQIVGTGPFEGADEGQHLAYALRLAREGTLPDRAASAANSTRQSSGQPPLYYAVTAAALRLVHGDALASDALLFDTLRARENRWYSPPDRWNPTDNRNVYLPGDLCANVRGCPFAAWLVTARAVSLAFGLIGVIAAYAGACAVFARPVWRVTAAGLFALTPQVVQMAAIAHNDMAGVALAAGVIALALWIVRDGAGRGRLIALGLLIGLAGLAKINALAVVPGAAAAVAWALRGARPIRFIRAALWAGVPAALVLGGWLIWGWVTYGDPLGTATHYRPGYFYDTPLALTALPPLVPEVILSYWGKLGSAVYLTPAAYTALALVPLLAGIGVMASPRAVVRWLRANAGMAIALALVALVTALALTHWLRTIHFITGRLAYAAHPVFALAVTGGLALLAARIGVRHADRALAIGAVGLFAAIASLGSWSSLHAAFGPIERAASPPAGLIAVGLDFAPSADADAAMRLDGILSPAEPPRTGTLARYTLCWTALTDSPGKPAAFSLKIFSQDGVQIADRTSLIGLGRYPSEAWRAGDRLCDGVDLPITGAVQPGATYNLIAVLLDAETMAVDWAARDAAGQPVGVTLIGSFTG